MRNVLPPRRPCWTFELAHSNQRFLVSVGYHQPTISSREKPQPAEVFVSGIKVGSDVEGVARDGAVLISIALQHGVPLDVMRNSITRNADGAPQTVIGAILDRLDET